MPSVPWLEKLDKIPVSPGILKLMTKNKENDNTVMHWEGNGKREPITGLREQVVLTITLAFFFYPETEKFY